MPRCHGFDLTGDYPEGNYMTRFLGHLVHRDAALRYFWGVYSKQYGIHTWSKVTLKHTQSFLKWVSRHIVCEHGRAYMLDKGTFHTHLGDSGNRGGGEGGGGGGGSSKRRRVTQ